MPPKPDIIWNQYHRIEHEGKSHPEVVCKHCSKSWFSKSTERLRSHSKACPFWPEDQTAPDAPVQAPMSSAAPQSDLKKLATKLGTDGPVKVLQTPRMVKQLFNGVYILQTTNARYVWEVPYYPQLYVPKSDLQASSLSTGLIITEGDAVKANDGTHIGNIWTLKVGDRSTDKVFAFSDQLTGNAAELAGMVKVDFKSIDQWFEEDTPIYVHPKDPFKRIDILQSKRHIRVFVDGKVVANTTSSMHLYETGLPARYYMPFTSVDASVLRPSKTKTQCPYKGESGYYSVEVNGKVHQDIVWCYDRPTLESSPIMGLMCFYNEKVDIELDGKMLERADTHFKHSKPSENKMPSAV